MINFYIMLARYLFHRYKRKLDLKVTGRIFEGIAIGIYATIIDKAIDNGFSIDLTIKFVIAIILTYAGSSLQKKDK